MNNENSISKKDQLKNLLANQKINSQPAIGAVALIVGLLGLTLILGTGVSGNSLWLGLAMNIMMLLASYMFFKGKMLNAIAGIQYVVVIKAVDLIVAIIFLRMISNENFTEIVLYSIVHFGIIVGIYLYAKKSADSENLNAAKKLKYIWI
jgi:accessory gene regulator protein AgrB